MLLQINSGKTSPDKNNQKEFTKTQNFKNLQ